MADDVFTVVATLATAGLIMMGAGVLLMLFA